MRGTNALSVVSMLGRGVACTLHSSLVLRNSDCRPMHGMERYGASISFVRRRPISSSSREYAGRDPGASSSSCRLGS